MLAGRELAATAGAGQARAPAGRMSHTGAGRSMASVSLPYHTKFSVAPDLDAHVLLKTPGWFHSLPNRSSGPCRVSNNAKPWEEANGKLSALVALCPTPPRSGVPLPSVRSNMPHYTRRAASTPTFAACIPPIYGSRVQTSDVAQHRMHHRRLGVSHTYLYVVNMSWTWTAQPLEDVTLLYLPWVSDFVLHSRGQKWQVNDCIHRAAVDGYTWVLSIDLDEFLMLGASYPGESTGGSMNTNVLAALTARHPTADVLTLGTRLVADVHTSINETLPFCQTCKPFSWANKLLAGVHMVDNAPCGAGQPLCLGPHGQRKHLVRASSVYVCDIRIAPAHRTLLPCAASTP